MSFADAQEALRRFWLGGKEGALCGREQARAWTLREVSREEHDSEYAMYTSIAGKLRKTLSGRPAGADPIVLAEVKLPVPALFYKFTESFAPL